MKILIYIATNTQIEVLARLALELSHKNEEVIICHAAIDLGLLREQIGDKIKNIVNLDSLTITPQPDSLWLTIKRYYAKKSQHKREKFHEIYMSSAFKIHYDNFDQELIKTAGFIKLISPNVLIVAEDGINGNAALIKSAKKKKVPVFVCPFGMGTGKDFENVIETKHKSGDLILLSPETLEIFPKLKRWAKKTQYGNVVMFPIEYILAREAHRLTLPNPWAVQGGIANYIMVESEAMFAHYRKEAIPQKKLKRLGTVYCDIVSNVLNQKSYKQAYQSCIRIDKEKYKILVSLPPSYHSDRGDKCEFSDYIQMCGSIIHELLRPGNHVTVSFHPAISPETRVLIQQKIQACSNLEFYVGDLLKLIPAHDLLVSCFSSAIRWALAARKPVLNYDFYGFELTDFAEAPGFINVRSFSEFVSYVKKLTEDEVYGCKLMKAQSTVSHKWGLLDGKNFERIYNFIQSKRARWMLCF